MLTAVADYADQGFSVQSASPARDYCYNLGESKEKGDILGTSQPDTKGMRGTTIQSYFMTNHKIVTLQQAYNLVSTTAGQAQTWVLANYFCAVRHPVNVILCVCLGIRYIMQY